MANVLSDPSMITVYLLSFVYPSLIILTLLTDIIRHKKLGSVLNILNGFVALSLILLSLNTRGKPMEVFGYFTIRIDVVSMAMMLLVFLVETIYGCYTYKDIPSYNKLFPINIHIALLGYLVILLSACTDWLTFIILWEAISFLAYYLILISSKKYTTTYTYFIPLHISGFFLLVAASLLYASGSLDFTARIHSGSIIPYLLVLGLIAKPGIFPYHFWVQKVYEEINPIYAGLFSSIIDPIGLIGLYRLVYYNGLPTPLSILAIILSIISILISIIWYWGCDRLSSILAWSTIYNMSWIQLSILLLPTNIMAWLFTLYLLAHGLAKFSAFVTLAKIGEAPPHIIRLINSTPAFLLGSSLLAIEGVPPFGLFFAKVGILANIMNYNVLSTILLIFSWAVSGIFFFRLLGKIMFPPEINGIILERSYSIDIIDYLNGFLLVLIILSPLIISYLSGGGVPIW